MLKIGFCINSLEMGGAEKLLVDVITLLYEQNKFEIYLLTKEKSSSYFYNRIKNKVKYFYLIEKKEENIISKLKNSIIKKINFKKFSQNLDIIIDFLDGDFYKYIKNLKDIKKLVWLHLNYEELKIRKKIENKLFYYEKIIVISDKTEKSVKREIKNIEVFKIYNLIDFQNIDRKLSEKHDLKFNQSFFITVCRLEESQKDVTTLIEAFSLYNGPEILLIVGDGKDRKKLEELVKMKKLDKRVKFLGTLINPYPLIKNSKAFILSSKAEGFGLVVAEALYCKTKVISSNCPDGPSEILLGGLIGELFEVGNVEQLLMKLNMIEEKRYNDNLIKSSLERYDKKYFLKNFYKVIGEKNE